MPGVQGGGLGSIGPQQPGGHRVGDASVAVSHLRTVIGS